MADVELIIKVPEDLYETYKGRLPMFGDVGMDLIAQAISKGIPLPKGHGRLVDADAIPEQIELKGFLSQDNAHLVTIYRVKEALDNAPTIIEADRSEEV